MLIVIVLLAGLWGVLALAPGSALGRALREALVDRPAGFLSGGKIGGLARLIAVLVALAAIFGAPEMLLLFGFVDMVLMMELAAFVLLATSAVHLRTALASLARIGKTALRLARLRAPPPPLRRGQAGGRRRRPRPTGDDDVDPAPYAWAWA